MKLSPIVINHNYYMVAVAAFTLRCMADKNISWNCWNYELLGHDRNTLVVSYSGLIRCVEREIYVVDKRVL